MSAPHTQTPPLIQINDDAPSNEDPKFVPALIVIDMQNDFVYGSLAVPGGEAIIERINTLIDLPFKARIATRDFHPDNHISFANTHQKPTFSKATIYHPDDEEEKEGCLQTMWPIHCVAYTGGADFVPGLKTTMFDAVVHKGTHPRIESYSAFRDVWAKDETDLPRILEQLGITDLYFAGLAGDYCVKYTAIDSIDYGYNTWLIKDAIKSISKEESERAFDVMLKKGAKLTTVKELQDLLAPPMPALN